ncbi:MAG: histidinol dehydrogenase [Oscillospiraceae bacterium]|jgi:histidinol dehydrogenase|nr:histidinol dehydrogenase [Oscillospiraceae bacterium]
MFTVVRAAAGEAEALLALQAARRRDSGAAVRAAVSALIDEVRAGGWDAVCRYARTLDGSAPREVPRAEWETAAARCPADVTRALLRAAECIRAYQERLLVRSDEWDAPGGGRVGVRVRGLTRVGLYVPGGKAAYPSSVLMNAIPAKVAGVEEIIMVTPPTEHLSAAVLAAAALAGVDRVFAVGGAQAVAALAFGAGPIPPVDKIVGPGNVYVSEAKRQLYGVIDIDMVAGPSEVLVMADESTDPALAAADMISQAEHDEMASAVLVTTDETVAEAVRAACAAQLAGLPRRAVAEASLRDFGAGVVCGDWDEACRLADRIAPEHLEILTRRPRALLPKIRNAGAVFLGPYSPEALGDYMAGPCHVLPTSGTARFFSPLSVDAFLKKTSVIEFDRTAFAPLWRDVEVLARAEGLHGHAASARMRFADEGAAREEDCVKT